jgi:hypothetical protein
VADQDDTIAALMPYVGHHGWCRRYDRLPNCTCGLADVLRGIDARKAGRIVAPVQTEGDDDGN